MLAVPLSPLLCPLPSSSTPSSSFSSASPLAPPQLSLRRPSSNKRTASSPADDPRALPLYTPIKPAPPLCTASSATKSGAGCSFESHPAQQLLQGMGSGGHRQHDGDDGDDKEQQHWIEHVDDGFRLDEPESMEPAPLPLNHPRSNSLGLVLEDLPPASLFFLGVDACSPAAYPSPYTPLARPSAHSSSYFPPVPSSAPEDPALPPSPALVPLALSRPPSPPRPSSPPPRVEPSVAHPLHRAKRLSMTPLSSSSLPLPPTPPPAAKLALRKGSLVPLPSPSTLPTPAPQWATMPPTPPLTPVEMAVELEALKVNDEAELFPTPLSGARSVSMTKRQRHA
ncbi:hypothetical protein JCM8097_003444 [Rhodosporidiobolus ruineniae]